MWFMFFWHFKLAILIYLFFFCLVQPIFKKVICLWTTCWTSWTLHRKFPKSENPNRRKRIKTNRPRRRPLRCRHLIRPTSPNSTRRRGRRSIRRRRWTWTLSRHRSRRTPPWARYLYRRSPSKTSLRITCRCPQTLPPYPQSRTWLPNRNPRR